MSLSYRLFPLLIPFLAALSSYSCRTTDKSSPLVAGGREDYLILPQSIGLAEIENGVPAKSPVCTGGFISDRVLLTAGHCALGKNPIFIVSEHPSFKGKLISSKNIIANPDYLAAEAKGTWGDRTAIDTGVVIFPADTAPPDMIMKIAPTAPKVGDGVQLVGWGRNAQAGALAIEGKRHYGRSKVAKVDPAAHDKITLVGITFTDGASSDIDMVSAGPGDSGGPLFNDKNEVIGVTSNIGSVDQNFYDPNTKTMNTTSNYANLNNPYTRKFIDQMLAQHGKGVSSRAEPAGGALPQCKKDNLSAGDITLVYEAGKGFMRLKSGKGFTCRINPEANKDSFYPSCASACKDQGQKEKVWGWCAGTEGFACKE